MKALQSKHLSILYLKQGYQNLITEESDGIYQFLFGLEEISKLKEEIEAKIKYIKALNIIYGSIPQQKETDNEFTRNTSNLFNNYPIPKLFFKHLLFILILNRLYYSE